MSAKTKLVLIFGWVIAFFLWWLVFVISLLWWNQTNVKTDINNKKIVYNKKISKKNNSKKIVSKNKIEKKKHSFKILTLKNLNSKKDWELFAKKYKNLTDGTINVKYYDDLNTYREKLVYKLATKSDDFDFAIIPAEWFYNTEYLANLSFKLWKINFQLSSIFDYNFRYFVKDNNIKAIPFAIDPIIWYTINKDVATKQDLETWKKLVINTINRLSNSGKLQTMPIFLGYDEKYINYIKKHENKTLFPIFDYILKYYIFKKNEKAIQLIKDFWTSNTYKTFDFNLFRKNFLKFRKKEVCKWTYIKYCLLFRKKTKLVYGFVSDLNYIKENWLKFYKLSKIKYKNIKNTTLAIWFGDEYPVRDWIIIINPNSKNINYMWIFLKYYTKLWQDGKLPFYQNLLSPFLSHNLPKNKKIQFLENNLWKFISLDKIWVKIENKLNKKIINYLNGDINLDILLR